MIYTSYFANWRKFPKEYKVVSISRFSPKYFDGINFDILSPSKDLLSRYKNGIITEEEYTKEFTEYLSKLDKANIISMLNSIGENLILCCYEKPTDFCHRHLVSAWLRNHGISCREWDESYTGKEA